jgi:ankyrin repeat protein
LLFLPGNYPDCAEALARAGCAVGLRDGNGETGRQIAVRNGHTVVLERLRAVVAEQLRVAQAAPPPAVEPAAQPAAAGDDQLQQLLELDLDLLASKLFEAAVQGAHAAVAGLLARGADPNVLCIGNSGELDSDHLQTPLVEAVVKGFVVVVRLLLQGGAGPDLADSTGGTPLTLAAGSHPHPQGGGRWAEVLPWGWPRGAVGVVRLLLDGGADPNLADSKGGTPLGMSAGNGHLAVLRLLLQRGAAVDGIIGAGRWTAFSLACYNNQPDCAEALARAGCDVGLQNGNGDTGWQLAERNGHTAVLERLRAVVAEQQRSGRWWPELLADNRLELASELHDAVEVLDSERESAATLQKVAELLVRGADPNVSNGYMHTSGEPGEPDWQTTPLVETTRNDYLEVARLLLDGGADPNLADSRGGTPLTWAAGDGQLEGARLLLDSGAEPSLAMADVHLVAK